MILLRLSINGKQSLKQPESLKAPLKNKSHLESTLGFLYFLTFGVLWSVGMYVKLRRPMHPMPNLGLIYPISWGSGCPCYYGTRLESVLEGTWGVCLIPAIFLILVVNRFLTRGFFSK
jgi:hypothetical protein